MSYNQYVAVKGAGRYATIVGREWKAYKAKHAEKVSNYILRSERDCRSIALGMSLGSPNNC